MDLRLLPISLVKAIICKSTPLFIFGAVGLKTFLGFVITPSVDEGTFKGFLIGVSLDLYMEQSVRRKVRNRCPENQKVSYESAPQIPSMAA
jgi:hypothetical protein